MPSRLGFPRILVVVLLGLALGAVTGGDGGWYLIMGSVLVGLLWLLLTGAWLLVRGTSERPLPVNGLSR